MGNFAAAAMNWKKNSFPRQFSSIYASLPKKIVVLPSAVSINSSGEAGRREKMGS